MSLGATFVRASDGYFYKEPILSGDNWFICFDEDDPPELVIAQESGLNPHEVLKSANVGYRKLKLYSDYAERDFGRDGSFTFKPANSYWFEMTKALDPKFITESDGKSKELPMGTYYDFKGFEK
jgi:hypothetical protein